MIAEFNHDPATPHFVSDGTGSSRASKGVENNIARSSRQIQATLNQGLSLFSFWEFNATLVMKVVGQDVIPQTRERFSGDKLPIYNF